MYDVISELSFEEYVGVSHMLGMERVAGNTWSKGALEGEKQEIGR